MFEFDFEDEVPNAWESLGGANSTSLELLSKEGGGGRGGKLSRDGGGGGGGGKFKFGSGGRLPKLGGGGGGGSPAVFDDPPPFLPMFISSSFLALAKSSALPFISYLGGKFAG